MKYYSLGELDEGIFEKDDVEQLLSKVILHFIFYFFLHYFVP